MHRLHAWQKILLLLCTVAVLAVGWLISIARIPRQVVVAGFVLPLDDQQHFEKALNALEERTLGQAIYIVTDDQIWPVTGFDLGVRLDRSAMWESAQAVCARDTLLARFWYSCQVAEGTPFNLHLVYDQAFIMDYLAQLGAFYWRAPQNARYHAQGHVEAEVPGRVLDIEVTQERLLAAIQKGITTVVARTDVLTPLVSQVELLELGADQHLASYSTYFDLANTGRVTNITAAALMLDGYVLEPGEIFSFNATVGPRTLERGFKAAEEIINQELVPGIGGGVCQVSSTLYNAALLAGLDIVQRRPHSKPLGYVPLGRDATVYYDLIDLQVRNPYPFSIRISSNVWENRLQVAIHAPEHLDGSYDVEVNGINELPFKEELMLSVAVPQGVRIPVQTGQTGWESKTWRVVYDATGRELYREQISHDVYPAKAALIQVHPSPAPVDVENLLPSPPERL